MSQPTQEIELLVRAGQIKAARQKLRGLSIRAIRREDVATYANLARRAGLFQLSLKILNPIVRPTKANVASPTANEAIEYAASLRSLGMGAEASDLLSQIDPRAHPEAVFQLAICKITEWRYDAAAPLLRLYIDSFSSECYSRTVGRINLLEALIHERRTRDAHILLEDLREQISPQASPLLYRKWLQLAAQLEIEDGRWNDAIAFLEEARAQVVDSQDSLNLIFISKWRSIAESQRDNRISPGLRRTKGDAIRLGNWETVRDCDFHIAKILGDRKALTRIYFGTPFESFRGRVLEALGGKAGLPARFHWSGDYKAGQSFGLDLALAQGIGRDLKLPPGQVVHRLLIVLSRDFYKPLAPLALFSMLWPDEKFNPDTSPMRVRQAIQRLRRWVREERVPIRPVVGRASGGYQLAFDASFSLVLPRDPLPLAQKELELNAVLLTLGPEKMRFSIRDVLATNDLSRSRAKRLLRWAVEHGELASEGRNRHACYRRTG